MERVKQAAQTARNNFCAETSLGLADACRAYSREEGTPVVTALALMAMFWGIGNFLDDRPVTTAEVDTLLRRVEPLLGLLAQSGISKSEAVAEQLTGLRDLIR